MVCSAYSLKCWRLLADVELFCLELREHEELCYVEHRFNDHLIPLAKKHNILGMPVPVEYGGRMLVDGMVAMEVPAKPLTEMGATHIVSVYLPSEAEAVDPLNLVAVVNRCFQVLSARTEAEWRRYSDAVIVPQVGHVGWDSFDNVRSTIRAGEAAAEAVIPQIREWFPLVTAS